MGIIRTVLGDIDPASAGVVMTHEHTLYHWSGAEYDHRAAYNWDDVIAKLIREFREGHRLFGLKTIVDCTTVEMGRHPRILATVSRESGVNVVAATGFFCETMGVPYHWRRQSVDEIAAFFVRDITEGIVGSDIRCGIIKAASGQDDAQPAPSPIGPGGRRIGEFEQRAFRAAARAQRITGAPITTHIDPADWADSNIGLEQLELLLEEGADPEKVIIGHTFFGSYEQIEEILRRGAYVQLDNIGTRWRGMSDETTADLMCRAFEKGYGHRLLLTFDRFWYQMRGDRPFTELDPEVATRMPLSFLPHVFIPMLRKRGLNEQAIRTILIDNPARLLTFDPPAAGASLEGATKRSGKAQGAASVA
ncbi:MAG: phosphotriesterase-related protein [Rhodospirillaceae bacterium]|jgi:phosphotriesterase-related protein|nr:phosphotriesterase-related protein [Rhodospirillaceae bacterium]